MSLDRPASHGGASSAPEEIERIVLLGGKISHSRSPRLHNHLLALHRLPYRYELLPVDEDQVVRTILAMKLGGYRGANVTSPYKEIVIPALDGLAEDAARIGAVNTIVIEDGRAIGHNTDGHGFIRSLDGEPLIDAPFTANIIGTGGAAMAAAHALLALPRLRSLTIYSRDAARAMSSARRWNDGRVSGEPLDAWHPADLVVHATPVGLGGDGGALLGEDRLEGTGLLYEMIYSPAETELMRRARAVGVRAIGGERMFVMQALRAFRIWTGVVPDENDLPGDLFA